MTSAGAPALPVPPLRPYSAQPKRMALQIASDVFVLLWIYVWFRVGQLVHDTLVQVAGVGYRIQGSAGQVSGSLTQAGQVRWERAAARRPARPPPDERRRADRRHRRRRPQCRRHPDEPRHATGLGGRARSDPARPRHLAAAALALRPACGGGGRDGELRLAGEELLALRALANRPLHELRRVAPDPVRAWRDGDADAIRALAHLELVADGVRWRRSGRVGARALDHR